MDFKQFYKTINFDIDNEIRTVYQATQGDTKSRGLLVDLIVGGVKTPVTTETMNFFALKPDGTRVMTAGVKDGTGFRIDFTNQTFAVPGTLLCALVLYGTNGEKIADKKFKMTVDSSLEDGAIISEDERGILDRAFDLANDIVPRLEALDVPLLENLEQKFDNLVATPVPTGEIIAEEIIDARDGEVSVGAKIRSVDAQLAQTDTELNNRIDNIIATPTTVSVQEIIDGRQGNASLGANLSSIKQDLAEQKEDYTKDRVKAFQPGLELSNVNKLKYIGQFTDITDIGTVATERVMVYKDIIQTKSLITSCKIKVSKNTSVTVLIYKLMPDGETIQLVDEFSHDVVTGINHLKINKAYDYPVLVGLKYSNNSLYVYTDYSDTLDFYFYESHVINEIPTTLSVFQKNMPRRRFLEISYLDFASMNQKTIKKEGNSYGSVSSSLTADYVYIPQQYNLPYGSILNKVRIGLKKELLAGQSITIYFFQKSGFKYNLIKSYTYTNSRVHSGTNTLYAGLDFDFIEADFTLFLGISITQDDTLSMLSEVDGKKYGRVHGTVADLVNNSLIDTESTGTLLKDNYTDIFEMEYIVNDTPHTDVKLAIIGDSLQNDSTYHTDRHWYDYLCKKYGCRYWSYAISGANYSSLAHMYLQVRDIRCLPTNIVVWGGTNDYGLSKLPLGTYGDTLTTSIYGFLDVSYKDMVENYPIAKFSILTPTPRADGLVGGVNTSALNLPNPYGYTLKELSKAIIDVANDYNLPCRDMTTQSNFRPWLDANNTKYFTDRLHLKEIAHKEISVIIEDFVLKEH